MDVPWLQLAVYAQPIVWILLYNVKVRFPIWLFIVLGLIVVNAVYLSRISFGFYTNSLLIFYILSVIYVAHHYRERPDLQPICLGFLIVFVNSFFWELPIHVADLLELDSFGVVAVQSLHLWPVPFLMGLGFKAPQRWWYGCLVAWTMIAVIETARMLNVMPFILRTPSLYLCRVIGLATLLWILRFPREARP